MTVLVALGTAAADERMRSCGAVAEARAHAGRPAIRVATFAGARHNLMRYRPAEVAARSMRRGRHGRRGG